jgi:hypothetical protein
VYDFGALGFRHCCCGRELRAWWGCQLSIDFGKEKYFGR